MRALALVLVLVAGCGGGAFEPFAEPFALPCPPASSPPVVPAPSTWSANGAGSCSFLPFALPSGGTLHWAYAGTGRLLVLNVNAGDSVRAGLVRSAEPAGSTPLAPGTYRLSVLASGDWALSVVG